MGRLKVSNLFLAAMSQNDSRTNQKN